MPALGVAQQTGILLKWLKAEGQSVSKGEPLMEVETDKATVEIEAAASGILANITARAGDEVPVGQKIAVISAPGEAVPTTQKTTSATRQQPPLPQGEGRGEGRPATSTPRPPAKPGAPTASVGGRLLASPAAKRISREKNIDLATLKGSGPEGSILAEDVLRAAPDLSPKPQVAPVAEEIIPLTPMRRIVGQRMTQSKQSAPHFYISMDIDMSAVSEARTSWKEKGESNVPSINDFILHACARALKDFPSLNST